MLSPKGPTSSSGCVGGESVHSDVPVVMHSVDPLSEFFSGLCGSRWSQRRVPPAPLCPNSQRNARSLQPLGTTSPISSCVTPPSSRRPLTPSQILATSSVPVDFRRTFCPRLHERSARTVGSVATKIPADADIILASADDIPNPPAPFDTLACARRSGSSVRHFATHPSSKNDDSSTVPGSSRTFSGIHAIRHYVPVDKLAGTALGPLLARHTPFAAP